MTRPTRQIKAPQRFADVEAPASRKRQPEPIPEQPRQSKPSKPSKPSRPSRQSSEQGKRGKAVKLPRKEPEPEVVSEAESEEAVRPSKSKQRKGNKGSIRTLQDALDYIDKLKIADGSKHIYKRSITDLANEYTDGSLISTILQDPAEVFDVIGKMTYQNDGSKLLSLESQKVILTAVRVVTSKGAVEGVDADDIKAYNDQMKVVARTTERKRGELERRGNLKSNPDLTWEIVQEKRDEFNKTKYHTIKNLRNLLIVSFYTMIWPRRLEIRLLKMFKQTPSEEEQKGNYVILRPRGDMPMILSEYKTAQRNQREFLGTYKKDLPSDLVSLVKSYVKKATIQDGQYLFPNGDETRSKTEPLGDTAFSKAVKKASKAVLGYALTANDYRHLAIDFVSRHIEQYNDNQIKEIANDIGDGSVLTALRYRLAEQANKGKSTAEIHREIIEERERELQRTREMEDEGSVGDINERDKESDEAVDEIGSVGGAEHQESESDSEAEVIMLKSKKSVEKEVEKVIEVLRPLLVKLLSL